MKPRVHKHNHNYRRLVTGLALAWLMGSSVFAAEADHHDHLHNPFEPTVTKEESILLNTAMGVAATNTAQAIQILTATKQDNASAAMDFAVGNFYFQDEQLDQAATAYQAALTKLPKFRSAMMNLGRVYLLQQRTGDAIELYQQLVADGQADADILLLLGHALLMENAPVSAEGAYRQCLLLRPKDPEAMLGLAKAVMQQERYAEGLALVGEILGRDPTNRELWTLRVNAYLAMGQHGDAARTIEKARRLDCADNEMMATLGDLLLNQDQPEDALQAYQLAFRESDVSRARLLRAIEGFLMVRDVKGAETMITRADAIREAEPLRFGKATETTLLRLKAELAQQQGRAADAIDLCKSVLSADPLDARTMLVLAELYQQSGQLEDAVMTCERAARVKGYEADALVRQAQIEVQRERYQQAIALLESAQTFRPQTHVGRYLDQLKRMAELK